MEEAGRALCELWPDAATQRETLAHSSSALALSWRRGHGGQSGAAAPALSPADSLWPATLTAWAASCERRTGMPGRMMREYHVRFRGGGEVARPPRYPASRAATRLTVVGAPASSPREPAGGV